MKMSKLRNRIPDTFEAYDEHIQRAYIWDVIFGLASDKASRTVENRKYQLACNLMAFAYCQYQASLDAGRWAE